ncbi:MAG TPA: arsenite methyltransferase [Candidatus Udaeobacter sp.]|jgi:SAM-dependent methyltransferase|nr:arsenite methyltransferase [Candidatus Udaeobacter sp.]
MSEKPLSTAIENCPDPTCCGGATADEKARLGEGADVRTIVRDRYARIAEGEVSGCCGGSGCGADQVLVDVGYTADQAAAIPEGANLGLGCGNPLAWAGLQPGEAVLDLGSGAGIDCFLAAREIGPRGRVIGVDMTPAMIDRARANAARGDYAQVEFRLGEIEHLPVADASVDVIVSNCVINLSPDKAQVFREARRALRPGGRLLVSDLVWLRPLPDAVRRSVDLLVGCVAGASLKQDYLALIREAGFRDIEVVHEGRYAPGSGAFAPDTLEHDAYDAVASIKVRAVK